MLQSMAAFLLGFIVGVGMQLQQAQLWGWCIYAALCAVAVLVYCLEKVLNPRRFYRGVFLFFAAVFLAYGFVGLRAVSFQAQALATEYEGVDIDVQGQIVSLPQRQEGVTRLRFQVTTAKLAQTGKFISIPRLLQLSLYEQGKELWIEPHVGEQWSWRVRLKKPHGAMNPNGFDYELWLWEQGVGATGYVRLTKNDASQVPQLRGRALATPIIWLQAQREKVRHAIQARVSNSAVAGVLVALVLGDQNAIARANWDTFRATGVAHLMSISGLHITLFAWVAIWLVGRLWRVSARWWPQKVAGFAVAKFQPCYLLPAPQAAMLGGLALAWLYAAFSGWGIPAQRTVWMLATLTVLQLFAKRWPWPLTWLFCLVVVLAFDPWAMLQAGFWLSFVAVACLFTGLGRSNETQMNSTESTALRANNGLSRMRMGLWLALVQLWREQWLISVALAPLLVLLFQQLSLIGLIANLIAIPWVTFVITPLGLLGMLLPFAWDIAAWLMQPLMDLLNGFAGLAWANWSRPPMPLLLSAIAVIGALVACMRLPLAWRLMGLVCISPLWWWWPERLPVNEFTWTAADVGQGSAVVVRTKNHSLLFDAGPRWGRDSDAGSRTLVPLLRALDVDLKTLVISHRDSDHSGGASAVQAAYPSAKMLTSFGVGQRCVAGQSWHWDGVQFDVLHPSAEDYDKGYKTNAMSCVLRISNGRYSLLLTGDIEAVQEQAILERYAQRPEMLKSDALLLPHHGSKTSSSLAFLQAVQPRLAIVQAGYRNRFKHPHELVIQRVKDLNIAVLSTVSCGAAHARSDIGGVQCEREMRQRYWHNQADLSSESKPDLMRLKGQPQVNGGEGLGLGELE